MEVKAILKTDSENPGAVADALNADNITSEGFNVDSTSSVQVVTTVETRSVSSMRATLDDLIACQQTAEKVMHGG